METEIKKKEQTMMCAENLKINEMRDKKINSQTTRETSGITLIALVVTIVVLLILAGITISLVSVSYTHLDVYKRQSIHF